jgi:hypothetical protein
MFKISWLNHWKLATESVCENWQFLQSHVELRCDSLPTVSFASSPAPLLKLLFLII